VAFGDGHIDVFWRGTDGALWHKLFVRTTGFWFGNESLGVPPTGPSALGDLTRIWLSLDSHADFFAEESWLMDDKPVVRWLRQFLVDMLSANSPETELDLAVNPLLQQLRRHELGAIHARLDQLAPPDLEAELGQLSADWQAGDLFRLVQDAPHAAGVAHALLVYIATSLGFALPTPSMFNLRPLAARAASGIRLPFVSAWAAMGGRLRMAIVGLESGELRYVTEGGVLLSRDLAPVTVTRMASTCEPLQAEVRRLINLRHTLAEQVLERADVKVNLQAIADLEADLKEAREALSKCVAGDPPQHDPVTSTALNGMIASATMPTFFPPVQIAGESYVDGGLRAVIPVEAAVRMGADRIIAVAASKTQVDPSPGANISMATVALRSLMDIAINEIAFRDVQSPVGFGGTPVTVIQPRIDIHTPFTIYPAFVRNRMAYGYMCAADAIAPPANVEWARQVAERIAIIRYGVARLECWQRNRPVPPNMVILPTGEPSAISNTLAAMKAEIRSLVNERKQMGAAVPSGQGEWDDPELWSSRLEIHPWARFSPPVRTTVPDLRESDLATADDLLEAAGLVPRHTGDFDTAGAWVAFQSPTAGTLVATGTTVTLNFKSGPIP